MSIFWDPRARKPQMWVFPFFIVLTLVLFIAIFQYGSRKADQREILEKGADLNAGK